MSLQPFYRTVRERIARRQFDQLAGLPLPKPMYFNWVTDVFEGINLPEHGSSTALIWTDGTQEDRYSFMDITRRGNQLLNFLRAHGARTGDSVFLQLPLLPENWLSYYAAIKGGLVIIPAATILGVKDLLYRFEKLLPTVVIADANNAAKIDEAEQLLGKTLPLKILVRGTREGWHAFTEIEGQSEKAEAENTRSDDPLFLFFTSGTTGMPKVVTHTHLSYPLGHLTTAAWIGLHHGDIHYNIAQPGWAKFAWSSFFAPWSMGATIFALAQPGKFDARQQLALMAQYRISTFCAPPTALRMLILEDLNAFSFNFRECVAAGEPLNPEIIGAWKNGTGMTLRDGYGQTESTALVANSPDAVLKFGSMGKPTFLYEVVIVDEEGQPLPVFEEGHIAVRTDTNKPNGLFVDYFGESERKNDVFKHNLYFTGDKAYQDEDGYIWFVGRDDDVIKASDYRVGPFEVESVLMEHEAVVESAVVGSPHPIKGHEVKAFIRLHPQFEAHEDLAQQLFAYARKNLAAYKVPRIIEFVDDLPKTISGKIRRTELRTREAMKQAGVEMVSVEYRFKA